MFVQPDDDPRADGEFHGERATLIGFLRDQRLTLELKCSGLDAAELVVEETPLVVYCPACAAERTPASAQLLCCPACGGPTPDVVSGRELEVVALEIES